MSQFLSTIPVYATKRLSNDSMGARAWIVSGESTVVFLLSRSYSAMSLLCVPLARWKTTKLPSEESDGKKQGYTEGMISGLSFGPFGKSKIAICAGALGAGGPL